MQTEPITNQKANQGELPTKNQLKKILGLGFGIAVVLGGTIGVGILRTPGSIASLIPNFWLIILCWLIGGIYILLGATSYAELGTMLPKAGGSYNYIKRAFGDYVGFISGWFDYIINAIAPAFYCIVLGEYVILLFPLLSNYKVLIEYSFLIFFTFINVVGVKSGSITQQVTSALKLLFFLILIAACFLMGGANHQAIKETVSVAPLIKGGFVIAFFQALQLVTGTYDGWMSVSFFAEEDADPGKNIPKSLFIGGIIITTLFILINLAMLYVLPITSVAKSTLPVSDAVQVVFGRSGATFITVLAIFSLISILNAYIMIPSRILYGLSRDGFFIKQGTYINKGGTPVFTLLISFILNLILIVNSTFEQLFAFGAFIIVGVTGLSFAAVMRLRKKEPNLPRPYRAWGYPYTTIITLLAAIVLFIGFAYSDRKSFAIILMIIAISYPAFTLVSYRRKKEIA